MIVLASQSASRRALLSAAQVPFEALSPGVDEDAAKEALRADGLDARALADALAELKARKVSRRVPGALVLGCDQTLSLDGGEERGVMIDKAVDRADAERILRLLSGRVHHLHSAAVIVLGNSLAAYNPPLRVAEEFAMLDLLSGGDRAEWRADLAAYRASADDGAAFVRRLHRGLSGRRLGRMPLVCGLLPDRGTRRATLCQGGGQPVRDPGLAAVALA